MPDVCVDASLVLQVLMPEDHSANAHALWDGWRERGTRIIGPPLIYSEVTSVLRAAVFFKRITEQEGDDAFQYFLSMPISVDHRLDLRPLAWKLAREYDRPKAYDSFYLAAAQAASCELWTGDRRLLNSVRVPWVRWIGAV